MDRETADRLIGTTLASRYVVEDRLGDGARLAEPEPVPEKPAPPAARRPWLAAAVAMIVLVGVLGFAIRSQASTESLAPAPRPTPTRGSGSGRSPKPVARSPSLPDPTASDLAQLYGDVGRELGALDRAGGQQATFDLWPRFRWIRLNDYLVTPEKRRVAFDLLQRLRADIKTRGLGSH